MLTIESASNPIFANAEHTCISLQVKFAEFAEILPFGATPHDDMAYGVELFNRAMAGEFGEVAPFEPTPVATQAQPTTTGAQTL